MQPGPGSLVVGSTLGVAYLVDRSFAKRHLLPSWCPPPPFLKKMVLK